MIDTIAQHILGLHGWMALAVVFIVPLLESSAFVGFIFPGEVAVLLGGVLAYHHRVGLAAVLVAATFGAILGDTVGYAVGHRYGRRLLHGWLGRFVRREHLERGERYLAERGGKAVLLGRFTAALRVVIPGLAGIARMRYRTFLVYNVAGGVLWATTTVFVGYLAGASWQRAAHLASEFGLALLALLVLGFGLALLWRVVRARSDRLRALGDRLAARPPAVWIRRAFPAQVAWLRRRLDRRNPAGLPLTATLAVAALSAWMFGGLTQDVLAAEGAARLDPPVHAFAVAHRTGWLTSIVQGAAWLGSAWLLVPLLAAATAVLLANKRRRIWGGPLVATQLWASFLGAVALYALAEPLVDRPRPPESDLIGHTAGPSFPSGQAAQAVAVWGMLAVLLLRGRTPRARVLLLAAAAIVALLAGVSQVYLGAHWLTDVLAGYALGAAWLAIIVALRLKREGRSAPQRPAPPPA